MKRVKKTTPLQEMKKAAAAMVKLHDRNKGRPFKRWRKIDRDLYELWNLVFSTALRNRMAATRQRRRRSMRKRHAH